MNSKISIIAEHIEFKPRFSKKDDSAENLNAIAEANKASPDKKSRWNTMPPVITKRQHLRLVSKTLNEKIFLMAFFR